MDDLNNLVLELAQARAEAAEAHARLVALMASTAIIEAQADEHFAKERVADLEDAIRAAVKTVLDAKVFEKAAPSLGLDFVTIAEEPQATIASDLTDYLLASEARP